MVRRLLTTTLLAGAALATTGAAPAEERAMLEAFDRVLTAMAYAASGRLRPRPPGDGLGGDWAHAQAGFGDGSGRPLVGLEGRCPGSIE